MPRYDLVVVGTGTGLDVANWAVEEGWSVAIVEKGDAGGTCLNRGCIPSKILIHSADVAETIRKAKQFGIDVGPMRVDFRAVVRRSTRHVDEESTRIRDALRRSTNPKYFEGTARFVGPKRLAVAGEVLEADRFLLATGARPKIPNLPGLADVPYLTSTEALRLESLPASMTILGGGYIGAELAHFFGALGTKVTIVQRPDLLLNHEDEEVAEAVTAAYRARGIEVLTGHEAKRVSGKAGAIAVEAVEKSTGTSRTLIAEVLLVAIGITPNSDTLDLGKTGVTTNKAGYIEVDEFLETKVPGIFALGDAVGKFALKHNANHEATYAFQNLQNPTDKIAVDYEGMPHAVFGSPQVAALGKTEEELRAAGTPYLVGRTFYGETAMGKAIEDRDGFVKVLCDPQTGKVLGCHIVGTEASTLLHEVLVAVRAGSIQAVRDAVHVHPALSEVVHRAANSLEDPAVPRV